MDITELKKLCDASAMDEKGIAFEVMTHDPYVHVYSDGVMLEGFKSLNFPLLLEIVFPGWYGDAGSFYPKSGMFEKGGMKSLGDMKSIVPREENNVLDFLFYKPENDSPRVETYGFYRLQKNIPQRLDLFLCQLIPLAFPKAKVVIEEGDK